MNIYDFVPGAKPSPPDYRDYIYGQIFTIGEPLPSYFNLENYCTPIRDQGNQGACVSFSCEGLKGVQEKKNYPKDTIKLSPLFLYMLCKKLDGIPNEQGTYPRVAMDILLTTGMCSELLCPYKDNVPHPISFIPTAEQLKDAEKYKIKSYARIQTIQEIKHAIFNEGPVLGAFLICENFLKPEQNKFILMPRGIVLGGHALTIVGWDDDLQFTYKDAHNGVRTFKGFFRIRNSWGDWGDCGYAWMPYEYCTRITDIGMSYMMEAWSSVDIVISPPSGNVEIMEMTIGSNIVKINGVEYTIDQPIIYNQAGDRALAPIRFVFERAGWTINFEQLTQKIIAKRYK